MSRTAALSRYLSAVDGPSPYDEGSITTKSRQSSNEDSSRASKSQQPAEVVSSLTMDDGDGGRHKVVVTPSSSGLSVREVVSSRNTLPDGRPRSRSAGRAPMRSSRDIVHDLYSRMGVDYSSGPTSRSSRDAASSERSGRSHAPQRVRSGEAPSQEQPTGAPSSSVKNAEKFQKRYRAAAALSASSRGRSAEQGTPERRSRSLGRRWPPGRSVQTAGEPPSTKAVTTAPVVDMSMSETHRSTTQTAEETFSPAARNDAPVSPRGRGTYGSNAGSVSPRWKIHPPSSNVQHKQSQEEVDDKTETSDVEKDEMRDEMPPPGSVKDRLSAYSASSKSKNSGRTFPKSYPTHYAAKRDHPPKIDIYEEIRKAEEADSSLRDSDGIENDSSPGAAPGPTPNSPSPAASAAADAAAELTVLRNGGGNKDASTYTKSYSVASVKSAPTSPRKSSSGVAGAFLAAINKSPQPSTTARNKSGKSAAPVREVATLDESGAGVDTGSVLSALSGDEFAQSPRAGQRDGSVPVKNRSSWSERNKLASYQKSSNPMNGNLYVQTSSNMKMTASVEKMVDERVQAQVKEMEARMEERMLKLESQLEQQMKARMDYMEAKIDARMDELQSMLTLMLNGAGQAGPPSPGRREI